MLIKVNELFALRQLMVVKCRDALTPITTKPAARQDSRKGPGALRAAAIRDYDRRFRRPAHKSRQLSVYERLTHPALRP